MSEAAQEIFMSSVFSGYQSIVEAALPVTLLIASCHIGINIIVRAFSSGRLSLRGGK